MLRAQKSLRYRRQGYTPGVKLYNHALRIRLFDDFLEIKLIGKKSVYLIENLHAVRNIQTHTHTYIYTETIKKRRKF